MALKASAHQRAAWRAVQHQLSAVGSRILLADADDKQKVSAMSAEAIGIAHRHRLQYTYKLQSAHSATCAES